MIAAPPPDAQTPAQDSDDLVARAREFATEAHTPLAWAGPDPASIDETMAETNPQICDMPAYLAPEAARILALPVGTVNAWCFGHDYRHGDGTRKRFHRVIEPPQPERRELSFVNLCELHLLAVIRHHHGVKLAQVRQAIDSLRRELRVPRPLATQKFLTNGVALFVEHAGKC